MNSFKQFKSFKPFKSSERWNRWLSQHPTLQYCITPIFERTHS
jgi:hypothetical protein